MSYRVSSVLEGVERCPQCNIARPLLEYQACFFEVYSGKTRFGAWVFYRCSSCQDAVAVKTTVDHSALNADMPNYFVQRQTYANVIIPEPRKVEEDLPERAKRYLTQALESLHAPDGAIMLAGSAIDAMLKAKGYTEGSVYVRIEKAVEDQVLTKGMSDWAHSVRLESNKPRHADLDEPHSTKELAEQTVKFAQALGEFLFVLPARVERGRQASEEAAAASEGIAD